jgi:hypothetical protein
MMPRLLGGALLSLNMKADGGGRYYDGTNHHGDKSKFGNKEARN